MRTLVAATLACLGVLAFVAPAQEAPARAAPAEEEPATEDAEVVVITAVALKIPDGERGRKNPVSDTPEVIERGQRVFASQCTMCHGTRGDGQGDLVERLRLTMPDFTSVETQAGRTDGELFYILSKGHGSMPGQEGRLKAEERWSMIRYIRTLVGS